MRIDVRRLFLVTLFALVLSACKTVTVTNPVAGKVYTTAPDVALSFPKGQPDVLKVTLNDRDITSLLAVTSTGATAAGTSITSYLQDGENFLRVTTPVTPTVKFIYDISGPMVHVTKVTEGSQLNIQGYVEDPSGVKSVTVNGTAMTLASDNSFNVNVANGSYVTFVSTDNINLVRTQKFARPSVNVTNSLSVRVSRSGLDFITGEVQNLLKTTALGKLIKGMNPMKHECILGSCYDINVNDATLKDDTLKIDVNASADGTLGVSGTMTGVWASYAVVIYPLIGWTSTITGEATVDKASFTATAKVSVGSDNKLAVSISSMSLSLGTLNASVGILPSWLVSPFLNAFKGIVEWILTEQLKQILPAKMAEMVDTFPSSMLIDINGNQLKPAILPSTVATPGNGLTIGLGARLYNVTTNGPALVGSVWKDMGTVPAASNVSPTGVTKDIGIVISQNMVNQALAAATASGMLNISLTENDLPGLHEINGVNAVDNLRVRMVPKSAPSLEFVKSSKGLATFRIQDLYLALDATLDSSNALKTVLGATIDVEATANVGVADNNALAIEFAGTPRVKIRAIDNASTLILASDLAQKFMDELTPRVLPMVMGMIGAVPLPSFEGYGLSVGEIWVTDTSANFLGIVASMVKSTVTANAPAPTTSAYVQNGTVSTTSGVTSASYANAVDVSGDVITIVLDGYNPSAGNLQYRYSLDGGFFSPWKERTNIKLYGLSKGLHSIMVCARTALLVPDPNCASLSFNVK